jgi:hypothetical protein
MNLKNYLLEYVSSGKPLRDNIVSVSDIRKGMSIEEFSKVLDSAGYKGLGPTGYRVGDEAGLDKYYNIILVDPSPIHSHIVVVKNNLIKGRLGDYFTRYNVHFDSKTNELSYIDMDIRKGRKTNREKADIEDLVEYVNRKDFEPHRYSK